MAISIMSSESCARRMFRLSFTKISNEHFQSKCQEPIFVAQHMRQDHLMQLFQIRHAHQAIVRDEKGKNVGIVTLEDVMEQLVGFFPH